MNLATLLIEERQKAFANWRNSPLFYRTDALWFWDYSPRVYLWGQWD